MTNPPCTFGRRAVLLLGAAVTLASCGLSEPTSAPQTSPPPAAAVATRTTAKAPPTPDAVIAALTPAGATSFLAATPENDRNHMLGRPGGYTARVAFELPGGDQAAEVGAIERGGGFEIWPDTAGAQKRLDYIKGVLSSTPLLGTEYDYLAGTVLVRVTGKVTPANAAKVEAAVKALADS